ncbi:DegT/DnrJ/EryC1/StrS family aminotransferase [Paenibacillus oleatilyticus]|uniref:DegT/DnrJ/EryC1/StrS family aminotransferase n=1 Tax=Paenibacillus oleatilyticus TaxID=2594886 RepID=UPI001C1F9B32|nr:DegT/DnrJ/EryC1/StrS family aminotransferase [Paenibacillus oleatilyticus]MBU7317610.1 DegT/DnrJ/EryC1/StrS family aminotransferase [Paenibacillus oleatilyticus]
MINVTKTYLPSIEKYKKYIDKIYQSGWLTNGGELTKELEVRLSQYLGVKNVLLVANGTLALQVAYKVMGLKGDVLTTPFSFVATTSSLVWEGLNPIFVDIDRETFNINPNQIERKITQNTSAIVATHVYGNACDIEQINWIAEKYNLRVIYDAAHAFGVNYKNSNILNYGDASAISFHSTKLFHTIEGGAIVFKDSELYEKAKRVINFGIASPVEIQEVGINAKLNEFQAAMGLCVLDDIETILINRKKRYNFYAEGLASTEGVYFQRRNEEASLNYSHFPIVFETENILLKIIDRLKVKQIIPRRYFYPSLESLPYLSSRQETVVSGDIAKRVLCLPLYDSLEHEVQEIIMQIIKQAILEN